MPIVASLWFQIVFQSQQRYPMDQARSILKEMGLPPEAIERALQVHGSGGDINQIAAYALTLHTPQPECIEEHLSDELVSSDEDAGADPVGRWIEAANMAPLPTVPPEAIRQTELVSVKVEGDPHAPQSDKEVGAVSDSIKELGVHEETWQDPICKLFQSNNEDSSDLPEMAAFLESEQREASFQDMGFSSDLIHRALQLHGAEAAYSTLLQFLLDHSEKEPDKNDEDINSELTEDQFAEDILKKVVPALLSKSPASTSGLKKKGIKSNWFEQDSDNSDCEGNFKDDVMNQLRPQSPIDWAAEMPPPATLCRSTPSGGGHRNLMHSHGFPRDLIERAILELGEGVEYDMLLEYLLYLKSQQDLEASTSGPSNYMQVNTVEKLVTECGFSTRAVERAVLLCNTPLWDAEQDQIVDLLDFLEAHKEELNMEEEEEEEEDVSGSDEGDGMPWTWIREQVTDDVTAHTSDVTTPGKRPLDFTHKSSVQERPSQKARKPARAIPVVFDEVEKSPTFRGSEGFGLPGRPIRPRYLKEDVKGAPFFYFENVASMPPGEWARIQRHLFDIEPEFVDSVHFSACRRPRGYIHNLPLEGRKKFIDDPPMTIQELMPQTREFWPAWDPRTKMNCINTQRGCENLAKKCFVKDGTALRVEGRTPAEQKVILHWCRRWNMVWTAPNIPTPIDFHEIEAMLGFDRDHSRNILSTGARYKALGNSFSIYTIAFHYSVLKPLYPRGIKVLSLFSGIGGAEVALHKIGIKLLVVVSVEIEEGARRCIEAWWASTKQSGVLDQSYHNVKDLGWAQLTELVNRYGGFDFIVGGSPCNNLSAHNRVSRFGLDGLKSTVFFEFSRIVSAVRELTIKLQEGGRMIEVAEDNTEFFRLQQRVMEFLWRSSFNTRGSNLSTLSKVSSLTKKAQQFFSLLVDTFLECGFKDKFCFSSLETMDSTGRKMKTCYSSRRKLPRAVQLLSPSVLLQLAITRDLPSVSH